MVVNPNTGKRRYLLRKPDRSVVKDDEGEPLWFNSKLSAKTHRDKASEELVVSPGPDHRKW